ncbi:hypothetical protein HU200_066675 [Digitaria exilis]|uniref:protein-serine/threonine phosphatase n=1 Tax=Digitaria exilis TaxID=1010633 RepID=A0A834ZXK3_9POAL|nr:hypothetical protein HU200_066675 [Digitaria exilis]
MSSKSSIPEAEWTASSSMWWSPSSPAPLYLSYGMVSLKGQRPALTDAVAAAESFTALSPPLGLDYFAVFDGGHLGPAVAERLRARLATAIADRIDGELRSETPRFAVASQDVAGWWRTIVQEAFRAVHGRQVVVVPGAVVALVLEKYVVIASSGAAKAVLSRGGEHVELASDHRMRAQTNRAEEKQSAGDAPSVMDMDSTSKTHDDALQATHAFGTLRYSDYMTETVAALLLAQLNRAWRDLVAEAGSSVHGPPPDVVVVERTARDDFLVLASDGLWDAVAPAAACALVRRRLVKTPKIARPGEPRLDARGSPTVLAGGHDNVSVVLVLFRDFWARTPWQGN